MSHHYSLNLGAVPTRDGGLEITVHPTSHAAELTYYVESSDTKLPGGSAARSPFSSVPLRLATVSTVTMKDSPLSLDAPEARLSWRNAVITLNERLRSDFSKEVKKAPSILQLRSTDLVFTGETSSKGSNKLCVANAIPLCSSYLQTQVIDWIEKSAGWRKTTLKGISGSTLDILHDNGFEDLYQQALVIHHELAKRTERWTSEMKADVTSFYSSVRGMFEATVALPSKAILLDEFLRSLTVANQVCEDATKQRNTARTLWHNTSKAELYQDMYARMRDLSARDLLTLTSAFDMIGKHWKDKEFKKAMRAAIEAASSRADEQKTGTSILDDVQKKYHTALVDVLAKSPSKSNVIQAKPTPRKSKKGQASRASITSLVKTRERRQVFLSVSNETLQRWLGTTGFGVSDARMTDTTDFTELRNRIRAPSSEATRRSPAARADRRRFGRTGRTLKEWDRILNGEKHQVATGSSAERQDAHLEFHDDGQKMEELFDAQLPTPKWMAPNPEAPDFEALQAEEAEMKAKTVAESSVTTDSMLLGLSPRVNWEQVDPTSPRKRIAQTGKTYSLMQLVKDEKQQKALEDEQMSHIISVLVNRNPSLQGLPPTMPSLTVEDGEPAELMYDPSEINDWIIEIPGSVSESSAEDNNSQAAHTTVRRPRADSLPSRSVPEILELPPAV